MNPLDQYGRQAQKAPQASRLLAASGVPVIVGPTAYIGSNGRMYMGALPAGQIVVGAATGSGVSITGSGTSFTAGDVGKVITVTDSLGAYITITAVGGATAATGSITGTLTRANLTYPTTEWWMCNPIIGSYYSGAWIYLPQGSHQYGNMLQWSDTFSSGSWTVSNCTKDSTSAPDPFGTSKALVLKANASSSSSKVLSVSMPGTSGGFRAGSTYTFSAYFKAGTVDMVQMTFQMDAFSTTQHANFRLSGDGSVQGSNGVTPRITRVTEDGWYRCSITMTATASVGGTSFVIFTSGAGRAAGTFSDGTETFLMAAAQLETESEPTEYKPTQNLAGNPAGLYFCRQESPVRFVIMKAYGDTSKDFVPYIPPADSLKVTTGSSIRFNAPVGVRVVCSRVTLPGNALGKNGFLTNGCRHQFSQTEGSGNPKVFRLAIGADTVNEETLTVSTQRSGSKVSIFQNRGVENNQYINTVAGYQVSYAYNVSNTGLVVIDTRNDQPLTQSVMINNMQEWAVLDGFYYEVQYAS